MTELVQLEGRHEDFARQNTRVLVASLEGLDDARKTQADFPHMIVLADETRSLSEAAGLVHPHAGPDGADADAPTTILVDRQGAVRWLYRSPAVIVRLSPDDVLQAVQRNFPR
jgi:peroxiredoxin